LSERQPQPTPADGVPAESAGPYRVGTPGESAYDLLERARGLLRDGHPHQAAMLLGRAKLIEPDKGSIREMLGRALFLSGRLAGARREFARAVQIDPVNDYAHYALGLSCAKTGQRTRAIAHLKLALAMSPDSREYQDSLSRIAG
jgi:Flp pilus assembly protein TadD